MKGFGLKCHISKAYRVQSTAFFRIYDVYRDKLYVFFSAHGARAEKSHVAKIFCTSISGGCPTLESSLNANIMFSAILFVVHTNTLPPYFS